MAVCTLANVQDAARGVLNDTQVSTGEIFNNAKLQPFFARAYRDMFRVLMGAGTRVTHIVYVVLPANTTVLIPRVAPYYITDMAEPELVEQRLATNSIAITSTSAATPITITTTSPHGLGSNGLVVAGQIYGVQGTMESWGNWFATITGASTLTLNGSSAGVAGTGGYFYGQSTQQFTEVTPIDLPNQGIDGTPQQVIDCYLWANSQMNFRGANQDSELRITYYASGDPPSNTSTTIGIDDALDFLSIATAAHAAHSNGWYQMSESLREQAYGNTADDGRGGLLGKFLNIQVLAQQRGPVRRGQPFRSKRSKFGSYIFS